MRLGAVDAHPKARIFALAAGRRSKRGAARCLPSAAGHVGRCRNCDPFGEPATFERIGCIVMRADRPKLAVALNDHTRWSRVLLFRCKPLIVLGWINVGFAAKFLCRLTRTSFPSCIRGFDSLRPLQEFSALLRAQSNYPKCSISNSVSTLTFRAGWCPGGRTMKIPISVSG